MQPVRNLLKVCCPSGSSSVLIFSHWAFCGGKIYSGICLILYLRLLLPYRWIRKAKPRKDNTESVCTHACICAWVWPRYISSLQAHIALVQSVRWPVCQLKYSYNWSTESVPGFSAGNCMSIIDRGWGRLSCIYVIKDKNNCPNSERKQQLNIQIQNCIVGTITFCASVFQSCRNLLNLCNLTLYCSCMGTWTITTSY